jgi:hypothetical protein
MQSLFEKFKNQEKITGDTIPFSFVELNEIYLSTDRKTFIHFMEFMTQQISENQLTFDIMLFVPECYLKYGREPFKFAIIIMPKTVFKNLKNKKKNNFIKYQTTENEKDIKQIDIYRYKCLLIFTKLLILKNII